MESCAVLYSGGKDSNLALHKALMSGVKIKFLISLVPSSPEAWMWHWSNAQWTVLQAQALEIPILTAKTEVGEISEMKGLETILSKLKGKIDAIVTGGIASRYQADRIESLCRRLGMDMISPLWGIAPEEEWQELLSLGFEIIITSVSTEGLEANWLGRIVDEKTFFELMELSKKYKFNLSGEGGEFETFVLFGPDFKKMIKIIKGYKKWDKRTKSGYFRITKAILI
ncbi:MAG: diphthine--ammonia ligase [Candidatus Aenigmatarchaeota archaeon]